MDRYGQDEMTADVDSEGTGSRGPFAAARALATQVKLPFMAPAVGTALFGALLAPVVDAPLAGALHVGCVALALYVAHLRDERIDAHVRGEETPSVPPRLLRVTTVATSAVFLLTLASVLYLTGSLAAALTLPPFLFAIVHTPFLETNLVSGSLDYPVAIAFVIAGGYAAQTGRVPGWLMWLAGSFVFVLAGGGITLDRLDRAFDVGVNKRTVPSVLGDRAAARVSAGLVATGGGVVLVGALTGTLPRMSAFAAIVPLLAAFSTDGADGPRAVRIQMAAAYPFAALLFGTTCIGVDCALVGVL